MDDTFVYLFLIALLVLATMIHRKLKSVSDVAQKNGLELSRLNEILARIEKRIWFSTATPNPGPASDPAPKIQAASIPKPEVGESKAEKPVPAIEPVPPHAIVEPKTVPMAPVLPRETSPLVKNIESILQRMWNWILVGDEFRPKNIPVEFAVAGTWLMRSGVVVLVASVAWFLKWSMDHGLLGPAGRVALSTLAGLGLMVGGYWQLGKRYQVLGQGLLGGGLAFLYFSMYAAGPLYHLVGSTASFALMSVVTLSAGILSVRASSLSTAVLGLIGGYATPVILSTGEGRLGVLYIYMLLLGIGALVVALWREWRLLHYLTFLAAWAIFLGSLDRYDSRLHFSAALLFLGVSFLQHNAMAYAYSYRKREATTLLEAVYLLVNAALTAGLGYHLISQAHAKPWPAAMTLILAAINIAQIQIFLSRKLRDRNLLSVFIGLAGFFLAWSVPLIATGAAISTVWSLMALCWLWVGLRMESRLLLNAGYLLYALTLAWLGTHDLRLAPAGGMEMNWGEYASNLWPRLLNFGTVIASIFTASVLSARAKIGETGTGEENRWKVGAENDIPWNPTSGIGGTVVYWIGVGVAFLFLNFEIHHAFTHYQPLQRPALTLLWCGLGAFLVMGARSRSALWLQPVVGLILGVTVVKVLVVDWAGWGFEYSRSGFEDVGIHFLFRLLTHGSLLALVLMLGFRGKSNRGLKRPEDLFGIVAVSLLFIYTSAELNTLCIHFLPVFRAGALSVLWALYAISFVVFGLRFQKKGWRYAGLALFAIVAAKIFFSDLKSLEMIWRMVAFLSVGIVLLFGSFTYLKASRKHMGAS